MVEQEMEELTPEIRETLARMREEMGDLLGEIYDTDFNLYRWLLGYHFHYDNAIRALEIHLHWRRHLQLDGSPQRSTHPVVSQYVPIHYLGEAGHEEYNHFVMVEVMGDMDMENIMKSLPPMEYIVDRWVQNELVLRKMMKVEENTGKRSGVFFISDMKDLVYSPAVLALAAGPLVKILTALAAHYPEFLHKILIVNAPATISLLMSVVRPFLPKRTKGKIVCVTHEQLQKYIHPSRLPIQYGGTLVDDVGDPHCKQWLPSPPHSKIPKELHTDPHYEGPAREDMKKVAIGAGRSFAIEIPISEKTDRILHLYLNPLGDVTGRFIYVEADGGNSEDSNNNPKETTVVSYATYPAMANPYVLRILLKHAGVQYKFIVDNSEAWIMAANVQYACVID